MRATVCAVAALAFAGCGGTSPEDQVRDTARHAAEALQSEHPEGACQYMVDREGCLGSVASLKALKIDPASAIIPADWRERLAHATIKVNGATATLAGLSRDGKPARYVRRGDRWLSDNR
jgi:hypothetical protein